MTVRPELHRQGIGRSLMCNAIEWGRDRDFKYLQVKTLGRSCPDAGYARTRVFCWAMGFRASGGVIPAQAGIYPQQ